MKAEDAWRLKELEADNARLAAFLSSDGHVGVGARCSHCGESCGRHLAKRNRGVR